LEEPESAPLHSSKDNQLAEEHFLNSHRREPDGRFIVELPFSSSDRALGESRGKAVQCLKSLEKQMAKDPKLSASYQSQFENYVKMKWVEPVPVSDLNSEAFYMPHHVVVKPESSTTKYRIVFNASAKTTNGQSLNSLLSAGPKIQTDLHPLLIRFRSQLIS